MSGAPYILTVGEASRLAQLTGAFTPPSVSGGTSGPDGVAPAPQRAQVQPQSPLSAREFAIITARDENGRCSWVGITYQEDELGSFEWRLRPDRRGELNAIVSLYVDRDVPVTDPDVFSAQHVPQSGVPGGTICELIYLGLAAPQQPRYLLRPMPFNERFFFDARLTGSTEIAPNQWEYEFEAVRPSTSGPPTSAYTTDPTWRLEQLPGGAGFKAYNRFEPCTPGSIPAPGLCGFLAEAVPVDDRVYLMECLPTPQGALYLFQAINPMGFV